MTEKDNTGVSTGNRANSVNLHVSFNNTKAVVKGYNEPISFYGRLSKYAKHKGISEQDAIRFATAMLLDKTGF